MPVNNVGIARFTAKLDAINRDAKKINLVLTENDPFPGLEKGIKDVHIFIMIMPCNSICSSVTVSCKLVAHRLMQARCRARVARPRVQLLSIVRGEF